uniref:Uncharacterized protein n=1 Tax=Ciona savignyi TaxID=51511 RepID=H2YD12_CIOSA
MLSRCETAVGGQGHRKNTTAGHKTNNNSINQDGSFQLGSQDYNDLQEGTSSGYRVRLRPRPTRQTEHYRSTTLKRKGLLKESDTAIKRTTSEPAIHNSIVVRPTRSSVLRQQSLLKKSKTARNGKSTTGTTRLLDSGVPTKRVSSEHQIQSDIPVKASRSSSQIEVRKASGKSGKTTKRKAKEVVSKLWYPFIPPAASSDSEEDFPIQQSSSSTSATTLPTSKLASKQSKSNKTKEKPSVDPSTSAEEKSCEGK